MAKSKNLGLGWQPKGFLRLKDTGFYPIELVTEIAHRFGIEPDFEYEKPGWKLKERLETAGTMYLAQVHNSEAPPPKQIREYFGELEKRSHELSELLANANAEAGSYLWQTDCELIQRELFGDDGPLVEAGIIRRATENDDQNLIAEYSDYSDVLKHLKHLEILAQECARRVPKGRVGRRENQALYHWVQNMKRYWEVTLGRAFTVYPYNGDQISEAGEFLAACIEPMDSGALPQLSHQMARARQT